MFLRKFINILRWTIFKYVTLQRVNLSRELKKKRFCKFISYPDSMTSHFFHCYYYP